LVSVTKEGVHGVGEAILSRTKTIDIEGLGKGALLSLSWPYGSSKQNAFLRGVYMLSVPVHVWTAMLQIHKAVRHPIVPSRRQSKAVMYLSAENQLLYPHLGIPLIPFPRPPPPRRRMPDRRPAPLPPTPPAPDDPPGPWRISSARPRSFHAGSRTFCVAFWTPKAAC
jgi:hypothetical protein